MDYKKVIEEHTESINKLRKIDLLGDLNINMDIEFQDSEIENLLQLSSLLSIEEKYHELSYEIASKLFKNFYYKYNNLYDAVYMIFSRLGNFPNRELLKTYVSSEVNTINNLKLIFEILTRENDNEIEINGEKIFLTDFQKEFYESLINEDKFSISAPTSAGKSFIFQITILKIFQKDITKKIAFIVPTRALITEFSHNLRQLFKKYNLQIDIRTLPLIKEENEGVLYIFTQERFNILLDEQNLQLDIVFVDEAQEIQGSRGVVLQNSIEKLLELNPNVKLYFASPLIKNPEIFNRLFNFDDTKKFTSTMSPVGQNIIFVSSVKNKPKQIKIELYKDDKYVPIAKLNIDFRFRKKEGKIIDFSFFITNEDEQTIIYSNTPSQAEDNALELAKKLQLINDKEVDSLIEYIKEDIHPDYSLIKCLKKGVAFHYANMPSNIKVKIEDLASKNKLKYICCTSTLLQGVNLPSKNIVIYKPKSGRNNHMKRSDFLNLIGRAGRLKREFNGNIWCIDTQEWENDIYRGEKLQEINSFYENALINNMKELIEIANNPNVQSDYEIVFGKFYVDAVIEGKTHSNVEKLLEVSNSIEKKLPDDIYKKHYSLHPEKLNRLYSYLSSLSAFTDILPQYIYSKGNNIKNIIKIIDKYLLNIDNESYKFISNMINKWIHNHTLREIILDYHNYYERPKISVSIKEVLEIIEKKIRYSYVLYTSAYIDILKYTLQTRSFPANTIDNLPNLPLYLEVGSGTKEIINLISLGLSRNTSIRLYNLKVVDCNELLECYQKIKNLNIDELPLPYILKEEIKYIL